MFHLGPKNPRFIVLSTDSENACISRDGTASSEYHPTHLTHTYILQISDVFNEKILSH